MDTNPEADYISLIGARIRGLEPFYPKWLEEKDGARRLAESVGVRLPKIFFLGPLSKLQLAALPDEFVVKPDFASSSIGVHLLCRSDDRFVDVTTGAGISLDEVFDSLFRAADRFKLDIDEAIICAEELLKGVDGVAPPADYRCYCFQGVIGMVVRDSHMAPGKSELMYFDGNFRPFNDIADRYSIAEKFQHLDEIVEAVVPENWRAIKAVAERVSRATPTPFVRVDLYDTPDGVVFGELTMTPGPYFYGNRKLMSGAESERLGRLWLDAKMRLDVERGKHS